MNEIEKVKGKKSLFKVCHACGHCFETPVEPDKCLKCQKAFLPLQYFDKIHQHKNEKYHHLFEKSDDLDEESFIKGLYVLW